MRAIYTCPLYNFPPKLVYSKLCKMSCQRKVKINCLVMIGFTNKQNIIRDSRNRFSHFLRHYTSGEEGWLLFIIYPFLLGLIGAVTSHFLLQKNRLNREKSAHFFTQKHRSNRREQKRIPLFGIQSSTILQTLSSNGYKL